MEHNTLDELLDSQEFKDLMDELDQEGYFDDWDENEGDGNTLADTGRYPDMN